MVKDERLSRSRGIRDSRGDRVFAAVVYILVTLILILVSYPLIYVVSASVSNPLDIITGKLILFPRELSVRAYQAVFRSKDLLTGYKNTVIYAVAGTAINIVLTTTGAYALSRKDMWGRTAVTFMISFTMFFGGGMIPTYIVVKNLGLLNSFWVMVLPGAISATNLLIMRNYFANSVPQEIIEAAYMDGCSNVGTLIRVVLPTSMSIVAVMVIFYLVGHWNSYFSALLYLSTRSKYTLQVFLREILIKNDYGDMGTGGEASSVEMTLLYESLKFAVIVVSTLPMMLFYPFMQRYFVKGVMMGSIKG
ncbi:MAG: carbohydrate ABC transporter permease [Clostridia bacterium]|nr:carbohydrate ABC transporter permease [Clostridia bacterium]MCR4577175.1 carbohydrate ABC transporter permease [Clostridiales bacterium]